MEKLTIAFDFDGTFCQGNQFPNIGEPRMWLIDYAKQLKADGHKLILWTCRENCGGIYYENRRYLDEAVNWCKNYGLEFDAVNKNIEEDNYPNEVFCRKVFAHYYIDDKSILVNDENKELLVSHPTNITNIMRTAIFYKQGTDDETSK